MEYSKTKHHGLVFYMQAIVEDVRIIKVYIILMYTFIVRAM